MIYVIVLLLAVGSIYFFFPRPSQNFAKHYDAILILGCPAQEDGTISQKLMERCDYALKLYRKKTAPVVIVSGDAVGNSYKEADVMENYLKEKLPHIIVKKELRARNTFQNLKFTKEAFPYERILVITSPSHLRRAAFFTKKFYSESDTAACPAKDRFLDYLLEYTRMWICLYYEIKLRKEH